MFLTALHILICVHLASVNKIQNFIIFDMTEMLSFEFKIMEGNLWLRTPPSRENSCERIE